MGIEARARLELAHQRATRSEFPKVVSELSDLLGRPLVAYLGEVRETSAVDEWADETREPSAAIQARLRLALEAALMIEGDGDANDRRPDKSQDPHQTAHSVSGAAHHHLPPSR